MPLIFCRYTNESGPKCLWNTFRKQDCIPKLIIIITFIYLFIYLEDSLALSSYDICV